MPNKLVIMALKESFKKGTRVRLIHMNDFHAVPEGTYGTVNYVDDIGSIHVNWDNGSTLALIPGEDKFEKMAKEE